MKDTPELRAAANRLADLDIREYQGPTGEDTDYRAAIMLAKAWIEEYPAEREPDQKK